MPVDFFGPKGNGHQSFNFGMFAWDRFYEVGRILRKEELDALRHPALVSTDKRAVAFRQSLHGKLLESVDV